MSVRRLFGKYDWLIFAALIIIAALVYIIAGRAERGAVCEIRADGKIVHTINLSEPDREFELPGNPRIRFKIKNNAVAFIKSDCPDKICVNTGYLSYAGQSAACLPNRVSIRVTGEGLDIVAK
jgi:hypothetical protein